MYNIRRASAEELSTILEIYERARRYMKEHGNPDQWGDTYPSPSLVSEDIANRNLYLACDGDRILCVFYFRIGEDAAYRSLMSGSWIADGPYGVIHRIASSGEVKGIASYCIDHCFSLCGNLRMDTHVNNLKMQHVLEKNGFIRCGTVYLQEEDLELIAYQRVQ